MARPRTFEREDVLDSAMDAFWNQGYEATSVQDLVDATGLNRASLYNTFGNKHELFIEVLERYEARWMGKTLALLKQHESARAAIRVLFEHVADQAAACPKRGSCLMTNAATELGAHDTDTADRVRSNFARMQDAFAATVRQGQEQGEIDTNADPDGLARFLVNNIQGLRVMAKTCPARADLQDIVDTTLAALPR